MSFLSTVLDFIFPPLCVHCRREGAWLCAAAQKKLSQEPIGVDPVIITGINRVVVRGSYDTDVLSQLIKQVKYRFWHASSGIFADVLQPVLQQLPKNAVIVPVPLHPRRLRERGFNQSDLIAKALSEITNLSVRHLLVRVRYTTPQARLTAQERATNIIGAMSGSPSNAWPKRVILVDDVITTGSTMAECASLLRQNGVRHITAVAIAKG